MDANCFCSCLKSLLDVQFCANIWSWQNKIYVILCKWQNISYLVLYTQCNMDKHCCCQGLACVHCIFMVWYMYPHFHLKLKYIAIFTPLSMWIWGHCGGDRMLVGFTTTSAISVQHYVIKCVSDLRQVVVFSRSSTNKSDRHYITEILLEVVLNNINVVLAWQYMKWIAESVQDLILSGQENLSIFFCLKNTCTFSN
jgi:hypothetical protein